MVLFRRVAGVWASEDACRLYLGILRDLGFGFRADTLIQRVDKSQVAMQIPLSLKVIIIVTCHETQIILVVQASTYSASVYPKPKPSPLNS